MTVRYILGRAGSGKSHRVLQEIKQGLLDGGEEHLLLLVPEQFTLQSERDLIHKLGLPGIMRVEVLSFTSLARRVFEEVGGSARTLLSEQGKHMVLRKIVDKVARELTIYRKASGQEGFVPKLSELLAELKGQDIIPAQLTARADNEGELIIKQKINDIALIYEHFNQYLQGRYLDTEDYINLFIEKINSSQYLQNTRVWLDGFSTFAPQSIKVIDRLMNTALDINVSLTLDLNNHGRDRELFDLSRKSFRQIQAMACRYGLPEEIIEIEAGKARMLTNPAIQHLEKEIYAYPGQVYAKKAEDIELFGAANLNSELEYAAAQIVALVRERGWRWKDLALVCNDMVNYGPLIKRVFDEFGIPCFMDQKRDIMNNSIIKLILSSIEIIRRGYRYEDVFSFLKTGFSGIEDDMVEKLENYALQYGINGQRWKDEFIYPGPESREALNQAREAFINPLGRLELRLNGRKPVNFICRAHYEYLADIGLKNRLEEWIGKMDEQGRFDVVRENTQLWNIVLEIFDQMVEIMGDQEVTLKEYLRILEAGFASLEVGIIPTTVDQVLVGDIQRSKSHDINGLLVVGINDGVLPSGQEEEGLFTQAEKERLMAEGLDIGFERNRQYAEERFLIYTTLTKPRQYLGLSYAMADGSGKALRPSLLIDRLQRLYPGLTVNSDVVKYRPLELHRISTPASSYKYLVENLRQQVDAKPVSALWWDVYSWYLGQEAWQKRLQELREGLFHCNQVRSIGADYARKLYPLPLYSTVSRVEQFVNCPFAHFIRYGLNPRERQVFAISAPDIGELFHNCLLSFAIKLKQENKNWREIRREDCDRLMDGIMDELVPEHGHGVFVSSHRYQYLAQRLKRISRRAVWVLTEQLQRGEFEPLQYEVSFGPGCPFPAIEIELGNGEKFYLVGRIDRVDLLEGEEGTYVKIIDYKSGNQDFKLSDVYYGVSLQLMIYLQAVMTSFQGEPDRKIHPAGIFYFKIDDPLIENETDIIENIEQAIARKLKMKGLVLRDVQLIQRLDNQITGGSDIMPVALTVNGEFTKKSAVLSEENFAALIRHVDVLLCRIGREIRKGTVKIEPLKNGARTACSFCSYRSICQFDRMLKDNNYRNIRSLQDEEVIFRLQTEKEAELNAGMD